MQFDVVSLFPEMFSAITQSGITRRAFEQGRCGLGLWNPRVLDLYGTRYHVGRKAPADAGIAAEITDRLVTAIAVVVGGIVAGYLFGRWFIRNYIDPAAEIAVLSRPGRSSWMTWMLFTWRVSMRYSPIRAACPAWTCSP